MFGHFPGLFGLLFLLIYALMMIGGVAIVISVVWAIWRMTWAHEKIERHVASIERLLAQQRGTAPS